MLKEANALGVRVLVLAGEGEPLIAPGLKEIVVRADELGLIPYIFTNGSLLDKEMAVFLKQHNASLVINLDSLNKGTYELLSGVEGSFEEVMSNIEAVRSVFASSRAYSGSCSFCRVAINSVVSQHNVSELFGGTGIQPMRRFCGEDFALVYNTPISIGRAVSSSDFKLTESMEAEIRRSSEGMVPLGTSSDGKQCVYMKNGISIGARGELLVCAYSLESGGLLRNFRDGGLKRCVGKANSAVTEFEGVHGHSRCVLRHPEYPRLIKNLERLKCK